jgi:hypothetical protein
MSPRPDEHGRRVARFATELRNASRLGAYADAIVSMYQSGEWRDYTTASGHESWRECEFDYFLISCDAAHSDLQRILSWDTAKAANIAGAMESDDPCKRRPLDEAAGSWPSPTGASLIELAARNGWTNSRGELRTAPVPARARAKLKYGVTKDEHARQQREKLIPAERRRELASHVKDLAADLSEVELRYVRDQVTDEITKTRSRSAN